MKSVQLVAQKLCDRQGMFCVSGMFRVVRMGRWSVLGPCRPGSVLHLTIRLEVWLVRQTSSGLVQLAVEWAQRVGILGGRAIQRSRLKTRLSRGFSVVSLEVRWVFCELSHQEWWQLKLPERMTWVSLGMMSLGNWEERKVLTAFIVLLWLQLL